MQKNWYAFKKRCWHILDHCKIHLGPRIVPDVSIDEFVKSLPDDIKFAIVKQEVGTDLYTDTSLKGAALIFSSIHRSGPIGLFTKFDTDFHIVKVVEDEECNGWRNKPQDVGGPPIEKFDDFKNEILFNKNGEQINTEPQTEYAVDPDAVDWGIYDIIISLDISIPERIVKKNPHTTWCYLMFEPSMRQYKASYILPLAGYDFFLNQRYRTILLNHRPKPHEVDFPYHLHYEGCFHDLLKIPKNHYQKEGFFIENRSSSALSKDEIKILEQFGTVRIPKEEALETVIHKELKSKYFYSLTNGIVRSKIWGNAMIEAVACGCLSFGNHKEYGNVDLFTPFTHITSFEEFIKKVKILESNDELYEKERNSQKKLLDYLCFYRPLKHILNSPKMKDK